MPQVGSNYLAPDSKEPYDISFEASTSYAREDYMSKFFDFNTVNAGDVPYNFFQFKVEFDTFCQSTTNTEPCKDPIDDPFFRMNNKRFDRVKEIGDLQRFWAVALRN